MKARRVGVLLFSLGGPDSLKNVQPYLFNIFADVLQRPGLPMAVSNSLAYLLARARAEKSRGIFEAIGGRSPLVAGTQAQVDALVQVLNKEGGAKYTGGVGMTYWNPLPSASTQTVLETGVDDIVLLPGYPQYSRSTTRAFLTKVEPTHLARVHVIPSYSTLPGYIQAMVQTILDASGSNLNGTHILFSAHGVPVRLIEEGDPYVQQTNDTVAAAMAALSEAGYDHVEHSLCFQSKVGPEPWTGPSLESEVRRLHGRRVVVVPVSFISEHSETLYELDIEYAVLARSLHVEWLRASTVRTQAAFIEGLAQLVRETVQG